MNLKSIILVIALLMVAGSGLAQTKLVVNSPDGQKTYVPVGTISEITFSDAGMTLVTPNENMTFAFSDISEITIDAKIDNIENATAELSDLTVKVQDGILSATAAGRIDVTVYNTQGQQVATTTANDEVNLDLNTLTKGVYIVRINNKTIKLTR